MFIDARKLDNGSVHDCDICVVGAGVAGLSLARRLEQSGLKVILLESGGLKDTGEFDHLNAGSSNQPDYPFQPSRARAFGGTSKRWTGACIELDELDFKNRSWLPDSGWPIGYDDISAYYGDAREIFGMSETGAFETTLQETPLHGNGLTAKVVQYSDPLDLGVKYHSEISTSESIDCWLYATATQLHMKDAGHRVDDVQVQSPAKNTISVRPRAVVLAGGGLENPRLLLNSNQKMQNGFSNEHDLVGRYHMEHPIRSLAILPIGKNRKGIRPFTDFTRLERSTAQGTFGLSSDVREKEGLLDLHFRVYRYSALEDEDAVIAAKQVFESGSGGVSEGTGIGRAFSSPVTIGRYLGWHFANKAFRSAPFDHIRLDAFLEQEPSHDSRVTLGEDRDQYGMRLPHLELQQSSFMCESHKQSLTHFSRLLTDRGFAGLRFGPEEIAHLGHYDKYGLHQMGSTRMASSPSKGVVDADCRVFGLKGLFVTGCSVFPTGGAANPTLTISALALRLADHLCSLKLRQA